MALSFKQTKGKALSNKVETYEYKDGENTVRLIGGILPRYIYWVKGTNNKDIPIECLAFNRDKEKFDNLEKDYVPDYYPDLRCSWSYSINCIDPKDGKVKALNLKKKLFEQIITAAEDLGDPTDYDTGWDVVFKRTKTGPLAFNVEYTLQVLRCKPKKLSAEDRQLADNAQPIDEKFPRPTPEEVKALLEKINTQQDEEDDLDQSQQEAIKDLG
ncbi:MAG: hypothetical protein EBR82_21180 [Caulobacteraceae bacterium]|nr:hypothetical protein [Caulobacteraceae bacterium]